jgi:hypothetical protein
MEATAQVPVGTIVTGRDTVIGDEGEYVYTQFAGVATVGMPCLWSSTRKAIVCDADNDANCGEAVGFALTTSVADYYGWLKISGKVKVKAGTVAAGGSMFLTATAGTVDDAAVAGVQVLGAQFDTADGTPAAGFAYATVNRPHIQGQDAVV